MDPMVVGKAYKLADHLIIVGLARRLLLVGDPGQNSPVGGAGALVPRPCGPSCPLSAGTARTASKC